MTHQWTPRRSMSSAISVYIPTIHPETWVWVNHFYIPYITYNLQSETNQTNPHTPRNGGHTIPPIARLDHGKPSETGGTPILCPTIIIRWSFLRFSAILANSWSRCCEWVPNSYVKQWPGRVVNVRDPRVSGCRCGCGNATSNAKVTILNHDQLVINH